MNPSRTKVEPVRYQRKRGGGPRYHTGYVLAATRFLCVRTGHAATCRTGRGWVKSICELHRGLSNTSDDVYCTGASGSLLKAIETWMGKGLGRHVSTRCSDVVHISSELQVAQALPADRPHNQKADARATHFGYAGYGPAY